MDHYNAAKQKKSEDEPSKRTQVKYDEATGKLI